MADRFAVLKTQHGTSPGPWQARGYRVIDYEGHDLVDVSSNVAEAEELRLEEDANHIAMWDPVTTLEVVSLLEKAADLLGGSDRLHAIAWRNHLNAFLTRIESPDG